MPGLDPPAGPKPLRRGEGLGIHDFLALRQDVDGRVKPTAVWHDFCLRKRTALILLGFSWLRIIWTPRGLMPCDTRISFFMNF
jgi:hypothetical protein